MAEGDIPYEIKLEPRPHVLVASVTRKTDSQVGDKMPLEVKAGSAQRAFEKRGPRASLTLRRNSACPPELEA